MKRLHVNVQVKDLAGSIGFYQKLFAAEPTVIKSDYAKWMLDDPRVNFSISLSNQKGGIEHLGIQAETELERDELFNRLDQIEEEQYKEGDTVCCYARSTKSWITDPQGVSWEIFQTHGPSETNKEPQGSCCEDDCCTTTTP